MFALQMQFKPENKDYLSYGHSELCSKYSQFKWDSII